MEELEAIEATIRRNRADRIAELAARGVAPRPTGASWIVGCEVFSVCLRPLGAGRVGVDVSAGRRGAGGRIWGEDAPGPDIEVEAAALLAGLTAAWPVISRPFRRGAPVYAPGPREDADWAALSGLEELPSLRFVADGPGLRLETATWTFDPGPECLIVVETLMTVGDLLAEMAGAAEAAAWRRTRGLADVLPFRPVSPKGEDGGVDADEVAYYAAKLGTDVDRWRGHMLAWAIALRDAWTPLPDDLAAAPPPAEETAAEMAGLAADCGMTVDELTEMMVNEGVLESRRRVFYAVWPDRARRPAEAIGNAPGAVTVRPDRRS